MKRTLASIIVLCAGILSVAQPQDKSPAPVKEKSGLAVAAALLGTDVQDRKLVGESTQFALNQKVYLWLSLSGGPADEIVVTWKQSDRTYETKLNVGGTTWHTWAYKTVAAAGPWEVTVSDAAGTLLKKLDFTVGGK
jgi:hypothetical protein